jgi:peroxiredoxin
MVKENQTAPLFTLPRASDFPPEEFSIEKGLENGPVVLAFFPGAFTPVCADEMETFSDLLADFRELDADVYGISVDSPFALNEFRDELGLEFGLISDSEKEIIDAYDVSMDFADLGVRNLAKRAVFVVDSEGEITYEWVSDDPGVEPDYDEIAAAAENAE